MVGNCAVTIGKLKLKNPVMVASGTFGYAAEFGGFMDCRRLGAIVTKTITLQPRQGNPAPRTCETPSGMLNSIGLENPGLEMFISEKLPALKTIGAPVIVSVASEKSPDEFTELVSRLDACSEVSAIELNISCPNVKHACATAQLIAQDPEATYAAVRLARQATKKTLITKLSPNVTDIGQIALSAETAGSDAVALINTLTGMSIDVESRRPRIAMGRAGLSGPAVRPVAVRMVWEARQKIRIPIIGMGGIIDTVSALEFILAGATAVSVGTANFVDPAVSIDIIDGISAYLRRNKIADIKDMTGAVRL